MLKNEGVGQSKKKVLPLDTGKRTLLVGPMVGSNALDGGYEYVDGVSSLGSGLVKVANWTNLTTATGCQVTCPSHGKGNCSDTTALDAAVAAAKVADQVVMMFGIDATVEKEGHDRTNISLPGQQPQLIRALLALSKPAVLVLVNGGVVGIEEFVDQVGAVVETFKPGGAGGAAVAELLVGKSNRWGRLPVTMYRSDFVEQQALMQYSQTKYPGRTYKYFVEPVVFPFGAGMGYHDSTVACTLTPPMLVSCKVTHLGGPSGDEVLQVYHIPPTGLKVDHPLPLKRLIAFERVHVPAGAATSPVAVTWNLTTEDLRLTDKVGGQSLYPGSHGLQIWLGHGAPANLTVVVPPLKGLKTEDASARPCDIYKTAGTPCVAAHSTVRALYKNYSGPLYWVERSSDGHAIAIVATADGFANAAAQDAFCKRTECVIVRIWDQSSFGNHLDIAPAGGAAEERDRPVNASRQRIFVAGHAAYAAYFEGQMGYRIDDTIGVARGNEPESMYAVFGGHHSNSLCCFDYGNAESNNLDTGAGSMEAIYFGGGEDHPWVGADLESGVWCSANRTSRLQDCAIPQKSDFVTAMLKGRSDGFALKAGDAQRGTLRDIYNGPRPPTTFPLWVRDCLNGTVFRELHGVQSYAACTAACANATACEGWTMPDGPSGVCQLMKAPLVSWLYAQTLPGHRCKSASRQAYQPMRKQGSLILGIGGDNSNGGVGTFHEGAVTAGYSSKATDDAIQRAVVAAGYRLKIDDASKRNLLVIIADDFRPAANHSFGMTEVSTPNIDELSKSGLTFLNAYSQFQWCSPSRNSESHGRSDVWLSHQ